MRITDFSFKTAVHLGAKVLRYPQSLALDDYRLQRWATAYARKQRWPCGELESIAAFE